MFFDRPNLYFNFYKQLYIIPAIACNFTTPIHIISNLHYILIKIPINTLFFINSSTLKLNWPTFIKVFPEQKCRCNVIVFSGVIEFIKTNLHTHNSPTDELINVSSENVSFERLSEYTICLMFLRIAPNVCYDLDIYETSDAC